MAEGENSKGPRRVKSVINAMRVLEVLKSASEPLPLTDISRRLGLRKSTVHLLLATLAEHNFVQADGPLGHYRLGLGVFEVGAAAVDRINLPSELGPPMERLADRSMEAVSLVVRSGASALIVRRYESAHILRAEIGLGTRMPLHASASGKVLLASTAPEQLDALYPDGVLPDVTGRGIKTKDALLRELDTVRQLGYATSKDEFLLGVAAVAAPVLDRHGAVVGALSIAGPTARFDGAKWVRPLLDTAAEMSVVLGHRKESRS